jgi:integrase
VAIENRPKKDGTPAYRVRIASVHPVTGKRQNITIGTFRTKRDAEKAQRKALEANDRGALVEPKATTVADLLDAWLTSKAGAVSPNSHKDYEIAVRRHLKPALGTVRAQRLGAVDVQRQYDK